MGLTTCQHVWIAIFEYAWPPVVIVILEYPIDRENEEAQHVSTCTFSASKHSSPQTSLQYAECESRTVRCSAIFISDMILTQHDNTKSHKLSQHTQRSADWMEIYICL
jgi:hypothetical protein